MHRHHFSKVVKNFNPPPCFVSLDPQVHKVFKDCDNISEIQKGDILAAYEIDDISAYWPTTPTEWEPHPPQEEWGESKDSDEEDEDMPGERRRRPEYSRN